jgi:AAA15 family ATPase/GTPase
MVFCYNCNILNHLACFMIKRLVVENFKKYKSSTTFNFNPHDVTVLVGGNNSGKSTILHALAIWQFCKIFLLFEKGPMILLPGQQKSGVGMSIDDFSPINLPSLKYLWNNLKPGSSYNLKIKCVWDTNTSVNKYLEFGLALNNERLLIKVLSSNIDGGDKIPEIAYLPPFAGITDKETWHSLADRKKLIGKGSQDLY